MKTITVNVSEPVYNDLKAYAKAHDRTTSELIRQAMQEYQQNHVRGSISIRNIQPVSLGNVKIVESQDDDLLEEMLDENRI